MPQMAPMIWWFLVLCPLGLIFMNLVKMFLVSDIMVGTQLKVCSQMVLSILWKW